MEFQIALMSLPHSKTIISRQSDGGHRPWRLDPSFLRPQQPGEGDLEVPTNFGHLFSSLEEVPGTHGQRNVPAVSLSEQESTI